MPKARRPANRRSRDPTGRPRPQGRSLVLPDLRVFVTLCFRGRPLSNALCFFDVRVTLPLLVLLAAAGGCRTSSETVTKPAASQSAAVTVQPGAPGQPSVTLAAAPAPKAPSFTEGDVKFMQGMIGHHAQAVEMVELLKTRTRSEQMQLLGKRIEISQNDEITMMRRWLQDRGQSVPMAMAHEGAMMPGMLSAAEMTTLAGAKGPAFDRLFLQGMIRHHGGALVMVTDLMSQPRAAEDAALFQFASDVEADQTMEIHRMQGMLAKMK